MQLLGIPLKGLCVADLPLEIPQIPKLGDFEAVKERCEKKAGAGTYEKLEKAIEETKTCIKELVNVEKVKEEVEEAKKTGSMDEVFGRYCKKRPELRECFMKTYNAAEPCLEEIERQAVNTTEHILNQIGDFVCFKDGDRIAMFVAEGGVECLKSRTDAIKNCVNDTVKFNPSSLGNSIPNLSMDQKKCDDMKKIQECIVKDLETGCDDSTPANVVDALFRFVKKIACKDIKKRSVRSVIDYFL
ncbi:unnamed protein product [Acanthoscelides obtectus]|uniref:27 kDa hemolymph protein n=1 Tax=Acanthoscelides obtectus TaxID=200917 RepID=A0A9P0PTI5_ACAOB|nr:unnamed protein product [Acanthoscelides obtectus]CAK1621365.1 hypothetical protein AOBTE_LOCUS916 [Acanthoscelides obtectus]